MIEVKEKNDVPPICPHCSEAISEVWFREIKGKLGRRYVYFRASCHKVLGGSHRKGCWMGEGSQSPGCPNCRRQVCFEGAPRKTQWLGGRLTRRCS